MFICRSFFELLKKQIYRQQFLDNKTICFLLKMLLLSIILDEKVQLNFSKHLDGMFWLSEWNLNYSKMVLNRNFCEKTNEVKHKNWWIFIFQTYFYNFFASIKNQNKNLVKWKTSLKSRLWVLHHFIYHNQTF